MSKPLDVGECAKTKRAENGSVTPPARGVALSNNNFHAGHVSLVAASDSVVGCRCSAVPLLWAVIGSSAAFLLEVLPDLGLLIAVMTFLLVRMKQ